MLKQLIRTCSKNCNTYLPTSKNKWLHQNVHNVIKRNAFFNFKTDEAKEEQQDDIQTLQNIGHLIKQIKERNKKLPPLLPEKDYANKDKLTVAIEMDEVLLYVFYPDEHEAYLQAPLR